jgi:diaminopimelate decarboxylase
MPERHRPGRPDGSAATRDRTLRAAYPFGERRSAAYSWRGRVLEVVELAAREGGEAKIVGLDVDHSVHATPPAGGTERGQYTRLISSGTTGGTPVQLGDSDLSISGGHLCFVGVDLAELADAYATPFFLYSERRLRANIAGLVGAFTARHTATEVFYASKACSNLWFLRVVRDAGVNVEVNSGGELEKALRVGFDPRQIVFNGVAKTRAEIERAVACGVRAFIVDSLCELERISAAATALGHVAAVAPRIDVHVPTLTHPGLETAHGGKAGIDRDDAVAAFRRAADDPHLEPVGLHLHVGSQITSVEPYRRAVDTALDVLAEVEAAAGVRLQFLDDGGGFAVPYREAPASCADDDYFCSRLAIDDYAAAICGRLRARRPDLALFLEPGRSVATSTAVLVTRIENEKTKGRRDAEGRRLGDEHWLTADAGFNTLLEHTNYRWYFRTLVAGRAAEPADAEFRLAGPLCDGGDVFAGDDESPCRHFPAGTRVGDVVVFLDAGGYTLEMMNDYNARPRAAAYAVTAGGDVVTIRRRETDVDLSALDLTPGCGV